jgi:peptide/nickel transport system ATP-binding protein
MTMATARVDPVLSVQNLNLVFETLRAKLIALNDVSLTVNEGEVVGLVGESGSGKSSFALAIMRLLPAPPARIADGGHVFFKGKDLLALSERQMEDVRGSGISMIFQEPLTALNPVFTIGDQLGEAVKVGLTRHAAPRDNHGKAVVREHTVAWLRRVGLPDAQGALEKYPYELSGGMRQRVMIAMAMASQPALILADEPTSALDATTQAQILGLLRSLIKETDTSVIFISHDLAVVAQIADRVAVMYAGMVVESAPVEALFERPLHPYTEALLACFPRGDIGSAERLEVIPGTVPVMSEVPTGCPFSSRCKYAIAGCMDGVPKLREVAPGHHVACVLR